MPIVQAIVLGLVQGLTEFLPVSSSAHLVLVPFVFGWKEPGLAFVVAVHIGTLGAVIYVFRNDVAALVRTALNWKNARAEEKRILRLVIIATLPAVVVGVAFKAVVGSTFDRPVLVSLLLGVTGYFLLSTETKTEMSEGNARDEAAVNEGDATAIGIAQAIAVLPGISRSGSTIGEGMRRGLSRDAAARFSFLLSIPIIGGAVLAELPDIVKHSNAGFGAVAIGIAVSAVTGFFAVNWFLGVVTRRGLRPFGTYCFLAMLAGLITALARG